MESSISPKFDEMEHFQNLCCHVKDAQNDAYVRPHFFTLDSSGDCPGAEQYVGEVRTNVAGSAY
jgi:hypothetical protein